MEDALQHRVPEQARILTAQPGSKRVSRADYLRPPRRIALVSLCKIIEHSAMNVEIRAATEADAAAMCALAAELGYPSDAEAFAHRVRTVLGRPDDHLLLVAQRHDDESVCGWIQGHVAEFLESGRRADIVGLVISSAIRRRGVGRALVERLEVWAKRIGAESIGVRSNVQRIESHLFYPALGYRAVKTQIAYRKQSG